MEIIDMSTKRKLKKMVSVLFILGCFFIGNTKCKGADLEYISQETANYAVQERGYDLPVDEVVKEEALIMEFLPITAEQIKKWAVFDSEHQTYDWERLGCLNYSPTYFGTSLPEVVEIRDSGEGNNVLVVDAVCDTFICNDAVITSELTVKFNDDKSFKYMGNKILNNGTKEVPKYQYRIKRKN